MHAAAWRVWRQQSRSRRTWLAMPAAGALSAASAGEAAPWPELGAAVTFGFAFALAITTIGAPGDDLASGAIAQDLLAGTSAESLVSGTIAGTVVAALPAVLAAAAVAAPSCRAPVCSLTWDSALVGAGAVLLGGIALAASFVLLGTLLTGRAATALTWPLAFLGFVPGRGLPLDRLPSAWAEWGRSAWDLLPLPHHVVAVLRASAAHSPDLWSHVWPLAVALLAAPVGATAVLRVRAARGRWG